MKSRRPRSSHILLDQLERPRIALSGQLADRRRERFPGRFDRLTNRSIYSNGRSRAYRAPVAIGTFADPDSRSDSTTLPFKNSEELEMLEHAAKFDDKAVLAARPAGFLRQREQYFGVQCCSIGFLHIPPPESQATPRREIAGTSASPDLFQIQANMIRNIAIESPLSVLFRKSRTRHECHPHLEWKTSPAFEFAQLFANERETIDEAFPVISLGSLAIPILDRRTLTTESAIVYNEIPRFTPESSRIVHNRIPPNSKQFRQGLDQLLQEGVIQICT